MTEQLDRLIKTSLANGESQIRLNEKNFEAIIAEYKIKRRLKMNKSVFSRPIILKGALPVFALTLLLGIAFIFVQPGQAIAEQVKSFIYNVVKTDDGKYNAVQVPYTESDKKGMVSRSLKDRGNAPDGFPEKLEGGYVFSYASEGENLDNNSSFITIQYKKGDVSLTLSYSAADSVMSADVNGNPYPADNVKETTIGNQTVVYGEYPFAHFPYTNDTEDRTQLPTIKTVHTLSWVKDGVYYKLYDVVGKAMTMDDLVQAATTIIQYTK